MTSMSTASILDKVGLDRQGALVLAAGWITALALTLI